MNMISLKSLTSLLPFLIFMTGGVSPPAATSNDVQIVIVNADDAELIAATGGFTNKFWLPWIGSIAAKDSSGSFTDVAPGYGAAMINANGSIQSLVYHGGEMGYFIFSADSANIQFMNTAGAPPAGADGHVKNLTGPMVSIVNGGVAPWFEAFGPSVHSPLGTIVMKSSYCSGIVITPGYALNHFPSDITIPDPGDAPPPPDDPGGDGSGPPDGGI
ncbi:MAG: hypothetical protein HY286_10425 [Planctomycetes bacterium]|nr:hypothetical protein [Planctomycetota bacterium]